MLKSIKIREETKAKLDETKVHPRQTYDEIIDFLVEELRKKVRGEGVEPRNVEP